MSIESRTFFGGASPLLDLFPPQPEHSERLSVGDSCPTHAPLRGAFLC
jgi:hypothetical protein